MTKVLAANIPLCHIHKEMGLVLHFTLHCTLHLAVHLMERERETERIPGALIVHLAHDNCTMWALGESCKQVVCIL